MVTLSVQFLLINGVEGFFFNIVLYIAQHFCNPIYFQDQGAWISQMTIILNTE